MKHIIALLGVVLSLGLTTNLMAQQGIENNGREGVQNARAAVNEVPAGPIVRAGEDRIDDRDIPGAPRQQREDIFLPEAIDELRDELYNSASVPEVVAEVEALKVVLAEVQNQQAKLVRENELLRKQLNSCCDASAQGLTARDAYLVQNAPNPFQETTNLAYFVPENVGEASLEIRDLKGVLLQSYELTKGLSSVQLDASQWPASTYVYVLVVEGEVVDSKVMLLK